MRLKASLQSAQHNGENVPIQLYVLSTTLMEQSWLTKQRQKIMLRTASAIRYLKKQTPFACNLIFYSIITNDIIL